MMKAAMIFFFSLLFWLVVQEEKKRPADASNGGVGSEDVGEQAEKQVQRQQLRPKKRISNKPFLSREAGSRAYHAA